LEQSLHSKEDKTSIKKTLEIKRKITIKERIILNFYFSKKETIGKNFN